MELKALVVDDEYKAREVLINLLQKYCPEITILGEAENTSEAYELIVKKQPNVVFLDIEMPGGNGFDLLSKFTTIPFEIIFITSYSHFAIKAIKFSALDYLLKPVIIDDLKQLVVKIKNKLESNFKAEQYTLLKENLLSAPNEQKLVINTKTKLEYVNISDIVYLKADGNYTTIVMNDNAKFYVSRTLKEYEVMLCQQANDFFVRIHKASIVNILYAKHIEKGDESILILNDNTRLEISRRKRQELFSRLNDVSGLGT